MGQFQSRVDYTLYILYGVPAKNEIDFDLSCYIAHLGRAMADGSDMVGDSGKVVKSIHHVGGDLFEFSV